MTDQQPRRRGRPRLPDSLRKGGANLTFRARDGLRERLLSEADKAKRSVSEEIEWRLEQLFEWQEEFGQLDALREKARNVLADAELDAHANKQEQLATLCAQLDFRSVQLPSGAKVILEPGQVGQLGPRIHDPEQVLRYLGAEPSGSGKALIIEAIRETLKPDLLQPEKGSSNEGQHNPARDE